MKRLIILFLMLLLMMITSLSSKSVKGKNSTVREKEISKIFKSKRVVKIRTVSGDCIVKKGKEKRINVKIIHTFDENDYKPEMREEEDVLVLSENFKGSPESGNAGWIITVPDKTEVDFKSASGDFSIKGLTCELSAVTASGDFKIENIKGNSKITTASGDLQLKRIHGRIRLKSASGDTEVKDITGDIEIRSASGDIEAKRIDGEFVIKTSSGDIKIEDSRGSYNIESVSGEIDVEDITLENKSSFETVSGEISVRLSKSSDSDLSLESTSGDVVLDFNGNPIKGSFEFIVKKEGGEIISPIKFEGVDEFYGNGRKYIRKYFQKGSSKPKITIKTNSGDAELKD
jgi:DUF4097 and DUF4098 domain-containing protein YvlB